MNSNKQKIEEFLRNDKRVIQSLHTMVSILAAARGTLISKDQNEISFISQVENDKYEELSGTYRFTIEKLK